MSFYSTLATKIICENLPSQNDFEHKEKGYNQCSWFVYNIINELKNTNWNLPSHETDFRNLHITALEKATNMRSEFGKVMWGESIFSKTISNNFSDLSIGSPFCVNIGFSDDNNFLKIEEMADLINYKLNLKKYSTGELYKKITEMFYTETFLLVNRHGQSFLLYPKNNNECIIFDSHVKSLGFFEPQNALRYILNNSNNNIIVAMVGYKSSEKINSVSRFDDT